MANTGTEHALMVVNKHLMNAAMELGGDLDTVSKQQAFAENIVRGLKNPICRCMGARSRWREYRSWRLGRFG